MSSDNDVLKTQYTPIIAGVFSFVSLTFFFKKRLTLSDESIRLRQIIMDRRDKHLSSKVSIKTNTNTNIKTTNTIKVIPLEEDIEKEDNKLDEQVANINGNASYTFHHRSIKHRFGPHHEQFDHDDQNIPELTFRAMFKYEYYKVIRNYYYYYY